MTTSRDATRGLRLGAALTGALLFSAAPASAQWSRVTQVPVTGMFSVWTNGDTIAAGADTAVYVSTDAGTTWQRSARPVAGVTAIRATRLRNGRLYAGTFGQGVFVSDDLGATWQAFNQGLVGGLFDSQLFLSSLGVLGDSLYAATEGAGVYVRSLAAAGTWHHFGDAFEPNQAADVWDLAVGGTRLLASAGSNGFVFHRDPGDADWTVSFLDNVGIHAGLQARNAAWTGTGWVVGTSAGVFRSVAGQEPWTLSGLGLGSVLLAEFATLGPQIFAAFDIPNFAVMERSSDDGATWQVLESLPSVFVYQLAVSGNDLYAARADGLWRRLAGTAGVEPGAGPRDLRFALAGVQPVGDHARLRFELPAAGTASIEVFDVLGRQAADPVRGSWSSGPHEVSLDSRALSPGVYAVRLSAAGSAAVVRLVHLR